ncbi:hypothetical protein G4Y79_21325 [Phototrophicus methaneseepsis]|uniref:Uncharacterized protein n=1 Tax=Phototrophicus methaneseepsis TaxID=2710758 RepID=A0A7S8IE93_9CHLR|nr:hypothetical protein [Phototrophicus methaneseepsis]QPC82199.1 hypothetical protein G4Y79_21325 [Phototrophicus methaneseepsis]
MVLPTYTQTNEWVAYLLDAGQNDMLRISVDGVAEPVDLGLNQNEFISQGDMAVSDDGRLLAYCKYVPGTDETLRVLVVRDLTTGTDLWSQDYLPVAGCNPGAFSQDGRLLAVGLTEEDMPNADPEAWSLQLKEAATGETVYSLEGDNDALPAFSQMTDYGFAEGISVMPDVQFVGPETVIFWAIPFVGRDALGEYLSYSWNYQTGELQQVEGWGHLYMDYLPQTGEVAYSALDPNQPAAVPFGPSPQTNMVVIRDESGSETVVYRNSDWIISDVTFVDQGQQLAVQLLSAYDPLAPEESVTHVRYEWVARDGTVTSLPGEYQSATSIGNAEGGAWVYWTDHDPMQPDPPIAHVDYFNGTDLTSLWVQNTPQSDIISFYNLLWTPPITTEADLPPFTAQ